MLQESQEKWKERKADIRIAVAVLLIGAVLKLLYAREIPFSIGEHDLGPLTAWDNYDMAESLPYNGHLGYIQFLYKFHTFPPHFWNQFYHPPLFYMAGAAVLTVAHAAGAEFSQGFEALQMLNMCIAVMTTVFFFGILRKLHLRGLALVLPTSIVALHPGFYNMGAMVNNDMFATMFAVVALYFTVCWSQDLRTGNLVGIAVSIGLGMLSKLTAVLVAPGIGIVLLGKLIDVVCIRKEAKAYKRRLIIQPILFALICFPLGLSWYARNYLEFGIPINYVMRFSEQLEQYFGPLPAAMRLGIPSVAQLTLRPEKVSDMVNIWGQLWITGIQDETALENSGGIAYFLSLLLLWSSMALSFLALGIGIVSTWIRKRASFLMKILFTVTVIVALAALLKLSFSYPLVCSMNFRYFGIGFVALMTLFGMGLGGYSSENRATAIVRNIASVCTILFCILSAVLYLFFARGA